MSIFDRRSFVKASAAGAAASWLASRASAQGTPVPQLKLEPLRIGLLGCGGRGTGAVVDALTADAGTVLVAVGDILQDRIDACLKNLGDPESIAPELMPRVQVPPDKRFVGFDALEKLLASGVDVVLLATPPHFRPAQIEACVAAGKHIFAEKPVAVDVPGARRVIAAAREAKAKNLALVSGFCWRSNPPERATYKRIHEGGIGQLRVAYATYNSGPNAFTPKTPGMSEMEWQVRNWYHHLWLGGDHIVEQAVHSVDKLNWAFNDQPPVKCWAIGGRQQRTSEHPGNIFDHFGVTFEYKDGARAFLMARQWENCATDNSDYLLGEKGVCRIEGWTPRHVIEGEKPWKYEGRQANMYVEEHIELFQGIRSGKPRHDGDWMTTSTLMAIMGRMAAYTGLEITWEMLLKSQERLGPETYALGDVAMSAVPVPGHTKFV
jgi:myo-inositol 2-dehydrogenase / D-chiro-inositol 1-dehydrogenase